MYTDIQDPSCSKWASTSSASMSMGCSSSPYAGHHRDHDWRTSPILSSTASDDYDDEFESEQPQLTSDCRRRPHNLVPPSSTISPHTPLPHVAIPFPADNNNNTKSQDVPPVENRPSFRPPSPAPRFNGFATSPLESRLSSSSSPHQHVAINNDNTRLRTLKVYNHGLPQNLPPPLRPIAHRSASNTKSTPPTSFNFVRDNYLTMLAQKPTDTTAAAPAATTVAPGDLASHQALEEINRLTASPEWQSLGDAFPDFESTAPVSGDEPVMGDWVNEPLFGGDSPFLTSPHDVPYDDFGTSPMETPFSSFLGTPSLTDLDMESPLITDSSPLIGGFGDNLDLFGAAAFPTVEVPTAAAAPKLPATNKLWTFSPSTPALDSINEPVIPPPPVRAPAPTTTRRRSNVTGTRKNLTPAALIPLDAPTQKRTYVTPSATSRKAVPDAIVKKRLHSVAFSDDKDFEEELGALSPTASEAEVIEYKRRQNTLAARKSRKRKLEHQQALEEEVASLDNQVTMWRERAMMAQELLRNSGVNFSFESDDQQ